MTLKFPNLESTLKECYAWEGMIKVIQYQQFVCHYFMVGVNKRVIIPGDQTYYPHRGQRVTVHYTAAVYGGSKFDCSRENGDPFIFRVGSGEVIQGWEQVIQTMSLGERSEVIFSPEYAYGVKGFYNIVPPGSSVVFDMELLKISP